MDPNTPILPTNSDLQNPAPAPQPTVIAPSVGQLSTSQSVDYPPDKPATTSVPPRQFSPPDHPLFNNSLFVQPQKDLPNTPSLEKPPKLQCFLSKKVILPVIAFLFLAGGGAGAYLGLIAPNQPKNMWNTALSRTAKGYDKLAEFIAKPKQSKGLALKGSFKSSGAFASDGDFEGSSNNDDGDFKGTISATGLKLDLELKTIKSPGNSPDIYFKVSGLQGLGTLLGGGEPELVNAFDGLNNKWYFIDHTLFDQFSGGTNTNTQVTTADVGSMLKAIGDASKEYIFTSDSKKAAIVLKETVGKEQQDGLSVYRYKASVNKQNLKSYIDKLCANLKNSNLKKFLGDNPESVDEAVGCKSLKEDADKINESKTADVWVDTKTKLIHRIKFTFSSSNSTVGDEEVKPNNAGLIAPK